MLEAGLKRRPMLTPEAAVWALLPIALGEVGLVSTFQTRSMKAKCGRSIEIAVVQEPGVDFTRSVLEHSKETLLVHNLAREVAELCGNRSELVCEFLPFGAAQGSTVSDVSIHLNNIARFADLCQTARKRDPVSALKRDPLFEIRQTVVGSALRWVRWRSGVARPEAHPAQVRSEARVRVAANCGF